MSAIDFELSVDRVSDPKGDPIKVTFNGKLSPAPGRPTALSESRSADAPHGETAARGYADFREQTRGPAGEKAMHLAAQAIRGVALGVVVTAILQSILARVGLAVAGLPFEFQKIIEPLTNPTAHGGEATDAGDAPLRKQATELGVEGG